MDPKTQPRDPAAPAASHDTGDWLTTPPPDPQGHAQPPPGAVFGNYEIQAEVARGGMGVIYRARQRELDRVVALKMILRADLGNASAVNRFLQEARAAAALDHPNVVPIYDCGEASGRVFFSMAFVNGPDLRRYVEARGVPPLVKALAFFRQIAAGVAHAHKQGIIHRDLKPANVLVDQDDRPRVTDFGLAKKVQSDSQLTGTGQILGTPAYMSPEQTREAKDVGPASDVYSLGGVLYFLLTGRPPLEGNNIPDLLLKVVSVPPVPPRSLNPAIPEEIEAICLRCLAKEPASRYPDAMVLHDEFAAVADAYLPRSSARLSGGLAPPPQPAPALAPPTAVTVTSPPAAVVPATTPSRGSWRFVAVAVSLVLAAGLVALGIVVGSGRLTTTPTDVGNSTTPGPDSVAWPVAGRGDFKLTVEIVSQGIQKDGDVFRLLPTTPTRFRVVADTDCSVAIFTIDPSGKAIQMVPNAKESDTRLVAKQERFFPPQGERSYVIRPSPTPGAGYERLYVVATTGELPKFPPATRNGTFREYDTPDDQRQLVSSLRSFVVDTNPDRDRVADVDVRYRVESK